ncbi:hypothetical protein CHRY9390_01657 [Chryseobacterium aquaeductus]|uniref:Tetratricopeptide repeat protein n=1 Tax=Chryseobacterium aquaeductus TaxID=2675056 RepID=A0A9N8MGX3_9FLAO|nr:hypothetical protein [Chryseobacterium aquaeductus]CAA7330978.1 hypothetical protein CHRY9390_01657 [Chryseobacterium potabilaquae]CAD7807437.1 hypothetical protein CHRY9390_01657 [Chryseobacterium aquaeductus]
MIHTRVLELLKNPKNIQSEDLHLLKKEINSFPYIQNIRALHLYGVHLYDKENYQKALSATAAYTTDKKILYQLINGKIQQPVKPEFIQEKAEPIPEEKIETQVVENEKSEEQTSVIKTTKSFSDHDYEATEELIADKPDIKHLVVKGERNRILFDGEENFLDEDNNETIDLESTLESGVIVTQKSVAKNNSLSETEKEEAIVNEELAGTSSEKAIDENLNIPETQVEEITDNAELNLEETVAEADLDKTEETQEAPKSEIIINEDKIDSEKVVEKINDESEISFQKIESFTAETEKAVEETAQSTPDKTEEIKEDLNPELIIDEEKIESQQVAEKINDDAELSFHGTDSFLPEVKIESKNTDEAAQSETPKSTITKHEDEMRRLIEEVEKRMKAKKESGSEKRDVEEEEINTDISFAETQAFHVGEEQKVAEEVVVKTAESIVEDTLEEKKSEENIESQDNETPTAETETEVVSTWKPMSFETGRQDSLLNKSIEIPQQKEESKKVEETPKSEPIVEETPKEIPAIQAEITESAEDSNDFEKNKKTESLEKQNGEAPVMNVSFFGSDIASLGLSYKSDQKEKADAKEQEKLTQQKIDESNVPGFINTWQSWLKIGRAEETPVDKTEIKNKVIESFIENNPKISQLKDEVNFVVKEKTDDISHLMTETLANLYIEQKLYSKAVNAFLVLSNKFPDRKEHFEAKIQEIKDNRNKN